MSEPFTLTAGEGRGRAAVLRVRGRLDARSSPEMMRRCQEARAALPAGRRHLVLNLADVTFLSSAGVGVLLALAEGTREDGGSLRLAPVSAPARSVLDVLNLQHFLTIDASEDAAIEALKAA